MTKDAAPLSSIVAAKSPEYLYVSFARFNPNYHPPEFGLVWSPLILCISCVNVQLCVLYFSRRKGTHQHASLEMWILELGCSLFCSVAPVVVLAL